MNQIDNTPRDIFLAAVRLQPVDWKSYLDQACSGDARLRDRVTALLEAHQAAGPVARPGGPESEPTLVGSLEMGGCIGPYKLRELLGEGGMGIVYVAEQEKPVRRKVALKLIKPGMDTREVIARFEAERQALALMDHPNIARVLDAGTVGQAFQPDALGGNGSDRNGIAEAGVESRSRQAGKPDLPGRPYFVMELVRGIPITEYCDDANVGLRERLALFVKVCQAVQHAHQKGVIHRDLKPSNVLVTLHDGVPVPKVIDFGVAKAINQRLTEHTVYTRHAQMVGTPLYMSPEQAELSGLDVDTRSDVYSLGVLLYELLTGTTPFDKETFSKVGFDEMRRMIREDEPHRPSQRVSTLDADKMSTVSRERGLDPRRIADVLRGELDWVVMKALEKDRTQRYESASALAADIERHLADEPVEACPPSTIYRLRKFGRRHRGLLTTTVLLALSIFIGTAASVWQAVKATNALKFADEKRQEADSNLTLANQRLSATQKAQKEADANFQSAMDAVDRMLLRVADEDMADLPAMKPIRMRLLNDALEFYEQFLAAGSNDPQRRFVAAQARQRVGEIRLRLGDRDAATEEFHETVRRVEPLAQEFPNDSRYVALLVRALRFVGGEESLRRSLEVAGGAQKRFPDEKQLPLLIADARRALANLLLTRGEQLQGLEQLDMATTDLRRHLADQAEGEPARQLLAATLNRRYSDDLGMFDEVETGLKEAAELLEPLLTTSKPAASRPGNDARRSALAKVTDLVASKVDLGETPESLLAGTLRLRGTARRIANRRADEIEPLLSRAVSLYEAAFAAQPEVARGERTNARKQWAETRISLASLLIQRGEWQEAESHYREVLRFGFDHEAATAPAPILKEIVSAVKGFASLTIGKGRSDEKECLEMRDRCLGLLERKLREPGTVSTGQAAAGWYELAQYYDQLGDSERKADCYRHAMATDVDLLDSETALSLAQFLMDSRKYDEALLRLDRSVKEGPRRWHLRKRRALAYFRLERYADALADLTVAVELQPDDGSNLWWIAPAEVAACPDEDFRRGILALADEAIKRTKRDVPDRRVHPDPLSARAQLHGAMGHFSAADRDFAEALELDPKNWAIYNTRGMMWTAGKQYEKAQGDYTKAIELSPNSSSYNNRGDAWRALRQYEKAQADFNKAIELDPKKSAAYNNRGQMWRELAQYEKARADHTKAIELDPNSSTAYNNRGLVWDAMGQREKALADYSMAIELDPKSTMAFNNRGIVWAAVRQYDKALADYAKSIGLDSRNWLPYFNRATTWRALQEREKAIADYDKAIELNPKHSSIYDRRGQTWEAMHQSEKALADYEKAIALNPANSSAYRNRGGLFAELKDWARARADFEKALPGAGDPAHVRCLHALCCLALHDVSAFRTDCEQQLRQFRDSRNPLELHIAVWTSALAPGPEVDWSTAVGLVERAVEISKGSSWTLQGQGAALMRARRFDEALATLDQSESAPPNPTTSPVYGWYFLAMTHFGLGHADEAREWLDKALAETSKLLSDPETAWNRRLTLELLRAEATQMVERE